MTTKSHVHQSVELGNVQQRFIEGATFDNVMAVLAFLLTGGFYLDGGAHSHGLADKTFFTPWHALAYGAFALNGIILVLVMVVNHARGRSWQDALPRGYLISLAGVILFPFGGVGDLAWHALFGFERGIDPLVSPTHLLLALSAFLVISGPLRSVWNRPDQGKVQGWRPLFPAVFSLLSIFSLFTFFTSYEHIFSNTWLLTNAYNDENGSLGVTSILIQAAIMMGLLLLALRRWRLPPGTLTVLLTINLTLMGVFLWRYPVRQVPMAIASGILGDLLLWKLKPSSKDVDAMRIFAFTLPVLVNLCFFVPTILYFHGIHWSIHLWLGVTVLSGVVGLLLSFLAFPPMFATESPPDL